MSTFRVNLARPETPVSIWDWSETVVAASGNIALERGYLSWVTSNPNPPPPLLEKCRFLVDILPIDSAPGSQEKAGDHETEA